MSTASELQLSGGNGAATGSLGGGTASAEAAAELAGRSTALLGLRDGLYRTCEAYANGALGDLAYALVLSRYGQLMATLFLGQDMLEAGVRARASSPDLSVPAPAAPPPPPAGGASKPAPSTNPAAPSTSASKMVDWQALLYRAAWQLETSPAVMRSVNLAGQMQPPAMRTFPKVAPSTTVPAAATTGVGDAGIAASLAQMQAAYLELDNPERLLNVLLVACINAEDPTRPARAGAIAAVGSTADGETLSSLCRQIPVLLARRIAIVQTGPQGTGTQATTHAVPPRPPRRNAGR
ncbi:MAG: hypothetical protein ACRYHQ_26305 [Janthinobacterium lividum]